MAAIIIACPECQTSMKVAGSAAGRRIRCPGCQVLLDIPREDAHPPSSRRSATQPPSSARSQPDRLPEVDEEEEDFDRGQSRGRPRPQARPRKSGNALLVWGAVAGGGVVLVACVAALVLFIVLLRRAATQSPTTQINIYQYRQEILGQTQGPIMRPEEIDPGRLPGKWLIGALVDGKMNNVTLELTADGKLSLTLHPVPTGEITRIEGTYTLHGNKLVLSLHGPENIRDRKATILRLTAVELLLEDEDGAREVYFRG